jgi:Domain of unknown function (DUF6458)
MGIGGSLTLIAIGAILKFAVTKRITGINVGTVGVILMIVGAIGIAITLAITTSRRRTDVVYRPDGATYVEPNNQIDPRL